LLHLNLGLAWFKQDRCPEAAPEFERTLARLPGHEQARELLAACRIQLGQPDAAAREIEALRAARPSDPGLLYLLGLARLKQGRPEAAREAFGKLIASAPAAQARYLIGKAHYENEEFEEAETELLAARAGDPSMDGLDRELGKVYISVRRAEDAEKFLRAALGRDAGDVEARYFLAGALILQDRGGEALPLLEEVAAARPRFWGAHYYRGRVLLQQSNVQDALAALELAAKLKPDESSVLYQLARAYRLAGRPAAADEALKKMAALKQGSSSDAELLRRK
jgi:predicted Zn-dependent protease